MVTLRVAGGVAVSGRVHHVGEAWVVVVGPSAPGPSLVLMPAVVSAEGLSRYATPLRASAAGGRLSLGVVLRAVARDRSPVRLLLTDGRVLEGTVDDVGRDHVDLAEHHLDEPRRPGAVRQTHVVSQSGLAVLTPAGAASSLAW
jgi:hypothetical protein